MNKKWKEEIKVVVTSLALPDEVLALLKTKAFIQNKSIASVVREAIYDYLKIDKNKYEKQ